MDEVAQRYAESLFSLAKDENKVDAYSKDMSLIRDVFEDKELIQFFNHVSISIEDKINVLTKALKGKVDTYILNFLYLLIKKRRIRYIQLICKEFKKLCNDYLGIEEGVVYSAFDLSEKEIASIEKAIGNKEGKTIQLRCVKDESLIGGVKVEINNHIYDDSISYRLESLKNTLLRK